MNLVCKTVAVCLLLSTMGSPALAQSPETNARIQRVTEGLLPPTRVAGRDYEPQTLEDLMAETGVPAVSIAVISEGRIEWTRAWGLADAASGQIATTDTLFQAASISKAVVATAALDMVEDGLLSLDAPVDDALRGWTIPENDLTEGHPVTLRHLLAHASGLTVGGFPGYPEDAPAPNVEQILDGVPPANTPRVEVDQTPGSARRYSGGGFTVLQLLIGQHENLAFPALMQTRVLSPAGMIASAVVLAVAQEYGWSWRQPRMITPVPLPAEAMGAVAGQYDGTPNLVVTVGVSPDGGSLLLTVADNPALAFIPQGDDGFIDTAGRARLTFERDEGGTVAAAIANGQRLPRRHP